MGGTSSAADELDWRYPLRQGITEHERRRARALLGPGERLLAAARGQDPHGPILWIVTQRRLVIVTHDEFEENVRDLRHQAVVRVDRRPCATGWQLHVAGDGRHFTVEGVDGEKAAQLVAVLRARAGLKDD
jgi:hypothetical protein